MVFSDYRSYKMASATRRGENALVRVIDAAVRVSDAPLRVMAINHLQNGISADPTKNRPNLGVFPVRSCSIRRIMEFLGKYGFRRIAILRQPSDQFYNCAKWILVPKPFCAVIVFWRTLRARESPR